MLQKIKELFIYIYENTVELGLPDLGTTESLVLPTFFLGPKGCVFYYIHLVKSDDSVPDTFFWCLEMSVEPSSTVCIII